MLATTLGSNGATVSTVEHLLASVLGLGIDNLIISVEGGEIPIMDGSAAAFLELFAEAGIRELPAPRKVMRISRPLELRDGDKYIRALPYAGFRVDCTIDFPHPTIGRERFSMEVTPENFTRVANARTFGFFKDVEYLHSHGLARGGSLESVVVLDDNGVMNPEGLRYKDEFVRHQGVGLHRRHGHARDAYSGPVRNMLLRPSAEQCLPAQGGKRTGASAHRPLP